jgi:hypothetical protein
LRQKAESRGVVRVLSGLRVKLRPEYRLAPDQAALQARQLLALQRAVARRVLARSAGDDIVAFPYIPYLSLFVDAVQLERLLGDPMSSASRRTSSAGQLTWKTATRNRT